MLKRRLSFDVSGPRASLYDNDPARHGKRRRPLFRPKKEKAPRWTPTKERAMSPLLEFILQHEEAFNKYVGLVVQGVAQANGSLAASIVWPHSTPTLASNSRPTPTATRPMSPRGSRPSPTPRVPGSFVCKAVRTTCSTFAPQMSSRAPCSTHSTASQHVCPQCSTKQPRRGR